jgi:hypothetical protein
MQPSLADEVMKALQQMKLTPQGPQYQERQPFMGGQFGVDVNPAQRKLMFQYQRKF